MHFLTKSSAAIALLGVLAAAPAAAQVTVKLYNTATDTGSGITLASLAGTFQSSHISFLTDSGGSYFPLGVKEFGGDLSGTITTPTTGLYTFTLTSDDGSYLFLNGAATPFINNGSNHIVGSVSKSMLFTANTPVTFDLPFHEDGTGASGVDLSVTPPGGVSQLVPSSYFAAPPPAVPEASTIVSFGLLLALGLVSVTVAARKQKNCVRA